MTEKRFVDYFDKDHNYIIQDLQNEDEYQVGFVNCDEDVFLELINQLSDENEQLKQYKQAVIDVLKNWSQKNLSAKQLQVVIAIMEELNVMGELE